MHLTFDSSKIEKTGSKPSPRHTYRFTSETGVGIVLPCINDSGNARTLLAKDLLDKKGIKYYEADADEHLAAPNGVGLHIDGCVMLLPTFEDTHIYVDCLVSSDISQEVIVSCHDVALLFETLFTQSSWFCCAILNINMTHGALISY